MPRSPPPAEGYEQAAANGHGRYAETPTSTRNPLARSALGETPAPGAGPNSRAFIYVDGTGLQANYAEVGWRGGPDSIWQDNVCGGSFDIQWTDANGAHQERHGNVNNCTTVAQFIYPGHYLTFDLSNETFKADTDVCGRYHIDGKDSPWACITMKP